MLQVSSKICITVEIKLPRLLRKTMNTIFVSKRNKYLSGNEKVVQDATLVCVLVKYKTY